MPIILMSVDGKEDAKPIVIPGELLEVKRYLEEAFFPAYRELNGGNVMLRGEEFTLLEATQINPRAEGDTRRLKFFMEQTGLVPKWK